MEERLQKLISSQCDVSRRSAEKMIADSRVTVNGVTAKLGDRADLNTDIVELDGKRIRSVANKKMYIMLNKPVGYVTTMNDEKGRKTVAELVSDVPVRVYPAGRLDINSSGLLIMTNDGELANHIMHPSNEKDKTYRVWVTGDIKDGVSKLRDPMELDGVPLHRAIVRVLETGNISVIDITIHEGKNRQVRRMCGMAGLRVKRLVRTAVGGVKLGNLEIGQWRELTEKELRELRKS